MPGHDEEVPAPTSLIRCFGDFESRHSGHVVVGDENVVWFDGLQRFAWVGKWEGGKTGKTETHREGGRESGLVI